MFYLKQSIQMYTYLLFLLPLMSSTAAENSTRLVKCNGMVLNDAYYDKQLLFVGLSKPYNLAMRKFSGILYFSHTIRNGSMIDFGIMACHVEKKTCRDIHGIPGGYAVFYDRGNDDIFFGGHDGIYKYHYGTKTARLYLEKGKSVWGLFIRRNFYYIEYPTQALYVYKRRKFVAVNETMGVEVDNFYITRSFEVYYSNRTALYKSERPKRKPFVLSKNIVIRQITEDIYGDVYFCASDGIYMDDKPKHRIKKVADVNECFGMAFIKVYSSNDVRDHVLYSDKYAIYKLIPSKYDKMCLNAILNDDEKREMERRSDVIKAFAH